MFIFETFPVYQKACDLHQEIIKLLKERNVQKDLKDQLSRSLVSIMSNIAEGSGKYTYKEKRAFYLIARGSTHESASHLNVMVHYECITQIENQALKGKLIIISKMLSGLIKVLKSKINED